MVVREEIIEQAKAIKKRIRELGLTQKALARRLGYSESTIYGYLSGLRYSKRLSEKIQKELELLEKTLKKGGE